MGEGAEHDGSLHTSKAWGSPPPYEGQHRKDVDLVRVHNPRHVKLARSAVLGLVLIGVALVPASIVRAHIDPEPATIEAGVTATVGFTVSHGCAGSPTIEVRIQVPEEITNAQGVQKNDWTTSINGRIVTFTDGRLESSVADSFMITFTAPTEPGTYYFPTVQICEQGESSWIEIPAADGTEPEHPAPGVIVTNGPVKDDASSGDSGGGHHDSPETGQETEQESAAEVGQDSEAEASETAEEGDGVATGLVATGAVALSIIAGTVLLVRRRGTRA